MKKPSFLNCGILLAEFLWNDGFLSHIPHSVLSAVPGIPVYSKVKQLSLCDKDIKKKQQQQLKPYHVEC